MGAVGQRSGAVPQLTGQENLAMQGRVHGMASADLRRRAAGLLEQFGLAEAGRRPARSYSGGMLRRLDIAMALVHRPAVLFLDEPTSGLDPEGRADLWALVSGLVASSGMTVLVTTHYLEEADQFAARVAIVDAGRIVAEGTPHELKSALHGDSVLLELGDPDHVRSAEKALADVAEVTDTTVDGTLVRARVAEGNRALPAVLAGLDSHGVAIKSVTLARPTLDDVYLHHAGRTFRQAEGTAQS
jgi:ABC-2 type transport system ATP-binding protein